MFDKEKYPLHLQQLEKNIGMILRGLNGGNRVVSILIIPVLFIFLLISINVYFSRMSFSHVISYGKPGTALATRPAGIFYFYMENEFHIYNVKNLNAETLYKQLTGY